jgi:hypothetical protein
MTGEKLHTAPPVRKGISLAHSSSNDRFRIFLRPKKIVTRDRNAAVAQEASAAMLRSRYLFPRRPVRRTFCQDILRFVIGASDNLPAIG